MKKSHLVLVSLIIVGVATMAFILLNSSLPKDSTSSNDTNISSTPNNTKSTPSSNNPKSSSPAMQSDSSKSISLDTTPTSTNSCVITVEGQQYDVQPLRGTHEGGDIFVCDTDMSDLFKSEHGSDLQRLDPYKLN